MEENNIITKKTIETEYVSLNQKITEPSKINPNTNNVIFNTKEIDTDKVNIIDYYNYDEFNVIKNKVKEIYIMTTDGNTLLFTIRYDVDWNRIYNEIPLELINNLTDEEALKRTNCTYSIIKIDNDSKKITLCTTDTDQYLMTDDVLTF